MTLLEIANLIVLAGAVVVALANIVKNGNSSILWINQKKEESFEEKICTCLNKVIPNYLKDIDDKLEEIKKDYQRISIVVANMNDKLANIEESNKDMLRREMNKIYSKYAPYEMITRYDKSDFDKFYNDYVEEHGNSYASDLRAHVSEWPIVESANQIPNFRED